MPACPKCRGLVSLETADGLRQTRCFNCGALGFPDNPPPPAANASNGHATLEQVLAAAPPLPESFQVSGLVEQIRSPTGKSFSYAEVIACLEQQGYEVARRQEWCGGKDRLGPLWARRTERQYPNGVSP